MTKQEREREKEAKKAVKESRVETVTDIASLAQAIKDAKPAGGKPDEFTGILLNDKVEKEQRGIRVFIKTDDNTYPVTVSRKDLVELFDNKFFGKKVKATRDSQRSYTIELV